MVRGSDAGVTDNAFMACEAALGVVQCSIDIARIRFSVGRGAIECCWCRKFGDGAYKQLRPAQ